MTEISKTPQRRHPLRLIVHKETQLRILWLVGGAVFLCMAVTFAMVAIWGTGWLWGICPLVGFGALISLWVSRKIVGPLYRIEKDVESVLTGAVEGKMIHLRQGDHLQHLADLLNQLLSRLHHQQHPS